MTRQEWIVLAIAFIFTVLASLNVAMETALQLSLIHISEPTRPY